MTDREQGSDRGKHTRTVPKPVRSRQRQSRETAWARGQEPERAGQAFRERKGRSAPRNDRQRQGQQASRDIDRRTEREKRNRAGLREGRVDGMADGNKTLPRYVGPGGHSTWSASSLLMAKASCSCSSSSPLLCGQACSASGRGPEPTAAEEAARRARETVPH